MSRPPCPGAADFIAALQQYGRPFLVLTNNSVFTPRDLRARLSRSGIDIPEDSIWTSALATARFLAEQAPGSSAYVIGEAGLTSAIHEEGFILADSDVEFVVLGETRTYSFEAITRAIRLVKGGAKFIATNPDVTGPSAEGPLPATGAVAAMITAATGIHPYYIGKPNPLMMRTALNRIGAHSETSVMIGDRMDTDVKSGLEAGMRSVLVLSGSTRWRRSPQYPFGPPPSWTASPTSSRSSSGSPRTRPSSSTRTDARCWMPGLVGRARSSDGTERLRGPGRRILVRRPWRRRT